MTATAAVNPEPRLSAMLSQVATVATISSSSLGLSRLDKAASKASDAMHNALSGTGRVNVSRLAGAEDRVKEINSTVAEARALLEGMTTAWNKDRLIANAMLQQFLGAYAPLKAKHTSLVAAFVADAPRLIADAEMNKGNYNVEIPTLAEINQAFAMDFSMQQIPDSATFKASGVSQQLEAEMRRHFEASIAGAYQNAINDALKRVAKPLAHLVDRIGALNEREADKAKGITSGGVKFYDSVIGNVQDIAAVFRSFNLTNDPVLDNLANKLDQFDGIDADDIKSSPDLRRDLEAKAKTILADLADLI